ncbi:MAG: exodeoxyribonuclease V subunit beta [Desulfobacter sp.]|nr:exodeoxyribonuclease V subunit beta [Desulfobacter sp.]WDP85871.1 MAG: exodeoxyribonuclease V subunit beta [Desulfobacter sp.]
MKIFPQLDPFTLDLEQVTLIEASAGTGKTYTITTLFARLVAMGYPVESILVVTFTEAAASELKLRIRQRLSACLSACNGQENPEARTDELAVFLNSQAQAPLIRKRLSLAITCFDQAAIMTIHSFCFSVLKENAVESGVNFDMELLADSQGFFSETAMDFFTARINDEDPLFLDFLDKAGITPEKIQNELRGAVARPGLKVFPDAAVFRSIGDEYRQAVQEVRAILTREKDLILTLISTHKGVDKRSYSKKNLPLWLDLSQKALKEENRVFVMTEQGDPLYKFTRTRMAQKTKAAHTPPGHPFFDHCEHLLSLYLVMEENLVAVKLEFLEYYAKALARMKETQGACFFDDLINDLASALHSFRSKHLKQAVLESYQACLIDEFQDTDPGQYDIFSILFKPKNFVLPFFMIGDPKQAIYGFRGGDIFAYLSACEQSCQQFTLATNYRSAPLLVDGINAIFSRVPAPFGFKEIPFHPVATPKTAKNRLVCDKIFAPPFNFVFVPTKNLPQDAKGWVKKGAGLAAIPDILAKDILSLLLNPSTRILDTREKEDIPRKISLKDMAVLVRTNDQAQAVQKALSQSNIPSFLSKTGSVFDSAQAVELFDILSAVDRPEHTGFLKAALASSVYGMTPQMFELMDKEHTLLESWQDRFASYHKIWEEKGFVPMISRLFHDEDLRPAPCDALCERALTNFYHLIELISKMALHQDLSRPFLLKWVQNQLSKETREETADELRLESDHSAVAIVTIHKSKGLEYPIVFLPYLWTGKGRPGTKGPVLYHDPDEDFRLCLDLGSPQIDRARAFKDQEDHAEEMRLLYVALTRASVMCQIYWGAFSGANTSALGCLLHPDGFPDETAMVEDLNDFAAKYPQSIALKAPELPPHPFYLPRSPALDQDLVPQKMSRDILFDWRITSYSALISGQGGHETVQREKSPGLDDMIILENFPKGAGAGDFFHSVFEDIDFSDPATIEPIISKKLVQYGFSGRGFGQQVLAMVNEVLSCPLNSRDNSLFSLDEITMDNRFTEMEFCFDMKGFDLAAMARLFACLPGEHNYGQRLKKMSIPNFKGFVKGFIDLVVQHNNKWYIMDYKSNYLGPAYGDYDPPNLHQAMVSHDYILQYHLYLVALDRYLRFRLKEYDYDLHMGGVFYLFIRGMKKNSQSGVFFHRPSKKIMEAFSGALLSS